MPRKHAQSPPIVTYSTSFRVQSAPPVGNQRRQMAGRKLSPLRSLDDELPPIILTQAPSTPDQEQIRMVLEQRMSQALAGPSRLLHQHQSSSKDEKIIKSGRRGSLIRSSAISSQDMQLIPIDDEEMRMLRSINKSQSSCSSSQKFCSDSLYKHEYEDKSTDEETTEEEEQLRQKRKASMIRQEEQEDANASLGGVRLMKIDNRRQSAIRNLEDRLAGYRHEKMRSSTRSGDLVDDQISGLVYDIDFDCYYNPSTDTYYRLRSQSKSGEGSNLQPREII